MLDERDPLIFRGIQFSPSAENQLPTHSPVRAFFKLYNLAGDPDKWTFVARIHLVGENGKNQDLPPISLSQDLTEKGKNDAMIGINLPFENVTPGRYRLSIDTLETVSNQLVTVQTYLQFH